MLLILAPVVFGLTSELMALFALLDRKNVGNVLDNLMIVDVGLLALFGLAGSFRGFDTIWAEALEEAEQSPDPSGPAEGPPAGDHLGA